MSALLNLQNKFQNYLLQEDVDFPTLIVNTEKVPLETRLAIYSNAYRARLVEALESNYPVLKIYLGDEDFVKIAWEYIAQYPSHYRSIRWFGDQLTNFINDHYQYKEYPYLSELAQFEWKMSLVFDAADSTLLQIDEIAQIPPESWINMRLHVHPSLQRINLSWNIVSIWQSIYDDQIPDEPIQNAASIPWILWRQDLVNRYCSLTEAEAWAIDAVLNQLTFGEICEGLCQWIPEQAAGTHAASLLKGWIQSGLLIGVRT